MPERINPSEPFGHAVPTREGYLEAHQIPVSSSSFSARIVGETGSGKELVARAAASARTACRPGVCRRQLLGDRRDAVRVRAVRHVRGVFTGATEHRIGLVERAHGGTLLLDEIGDVVAATNRDLAGDAVAGRAASWHQPSPLYRRIAKFGLDRVARAA